MKIGSVLLLAAFLDEKLVHADTRADQLEALTVSMPDTRPDQARAAAKAALAVETNTIQAEILISIAWGESRFDPTVRTGHVCGPMQTVPIVEADCVRWRDPVEGFKAGRDELIYELEHDRRVHGDLRLALLAYACGNRAFDGTCTKLGYPTIIINRAKTLGWKSGRTRGSS